MWTLITSFFKSSWLAVAGWGAILLAVGSVLLSIRKSGEDKIRNQDLQKTLEEVKASEQAQMQVNSLSDTQLEQLRDEWTH